jgi:hypothetical protein
VAVVAQVLPPAMLLAVSVSAVLLLLGASLSGAAGDSSRSSFPGMPRWNTTVPDATKPWAGLPRLPSNASVVIHTVYRATRKVGTYNHGPMIVRYGGLIIVNWYAGQTDEDAPGERVLFAFSGDEGATFSTPQPMFGRLSPTAAVGSAGVLVSNDEFAVVGGRLYGLAQSHECTACPAGAVPGRSSGLLRRVYVEEGGGGDLGSGGSGNGSNLTVRLGPAVWRSPSRAAVPRGAAAMAIPLYTEVTDGQLKQDAEAIMRDTITTVPCHDGAEHCAVPAPAGVSLNERSVYQRTFLSQVQLVMLLRCTTIPFEWASFCNLFMTSQLPSQASWRTTLARNGQMSCNWSMATPTTIPDAHTRTHVGVLPDGRTYLLGTQVSNTSLRHRRDPLTLSLSPDGVSFDQVWALRYGAPEKRYNGSHKDYGFAYPSAVVDRSRETLQIAYSINKEDIEMMTLPLSVLGPRPLPP